MRFLTPRQSTIALVGCLDYGVQERMLPAIISLVYENFGSDAAALLKSKILTQRGDSSTTFLRPYTSNQFFADVAPGERF